MQIQLKNNRDYKNEKRLIFALVAILLLPAVKFTIVQSIPGLYLYNNHANIIISFVLSLILIPSVPVIINRSKLLLTVLLIILTGFIVSNYFFFPSNRLNIVSHLFDIYFISFICISLSISIRNYKLVLDYLYKASYIIVLFGLLMFISTSILGAVGIAESEYNMSLSYYLVVPTNALLLKHFKEKSKSSIFAFLIGLLIIIAMGSRGSLLCVIVFIILYGIKYKKITYYSILSLIGFIIIAILIFINRSSIFLWLYQSLLHININSRTLYYLSNDIITNLSNRDLIINELFIKIQLNPITGIGFLGDLRSHNIIMESILFFGFPIGTLLLIFLFFVVLKSITYNKNTELSMLIVLFLSYAIPDALLNLTVWGKDMFWIYIGLAISTYIVEFKSKNFNNIY